MTIFQHCRGLLPLARELGVGLWIDIHDYDGVNAYHVEFIEAATRRGIGAEWRRLVRDRGGTR